MAVSRNSSPESDSRSGSVPAVILNKLLALAGSETRRWLIAFSGGLDSTVLLHALAGQSRRPLLAVHINHQLHPLADSWSQHCAAFCSEHGIEFHCQSVDVTGAADLGLEAAARKARYTALEGLMEAGDVLVTAHHLRDQAETLLLQLLRGSGLPGLAAMPECAVFGPGQLLRPLLALTREQLEHYASTQALTWIDDPSNTDESMDRNFIRHQLLPLLHSRWPAAEAVLARSAGHAGEAAELLQALAESDAQDAGGIHAGKLSLSGLNSLPVARQKNLLRHWLKQQGCVMPSAAQLDSILVDLVQAREDAEPVYRATDYELRRYRNALYCMTPLEKPPSVGMEMAWDGNAKIDLPPGCGQLRARSVLAGDAALPAGDYRVRFVQGGERIKPPGSAHHRRLKTLLQEAGVPPWVRRRMPLIYHGQELVAVADSWMNSDFIQTAVQQGWKPEWLGAPPGWNRRKH